MLFFPDAQGHLQHLQGSAGWGQKEGPLQEQGGRLPRQEDLPPDVHGGVLQQEGQGDPRGLEEGFHQVQ